MSHTSRDGWKPLVHITPSEAGGPIHTRSFTGVFRNVRRIVSGCLILIFMGTAWIEWNGHQAVLWDLGARQFHVFGMTFWPQDFVLLSILLMVCAFGLFFVTVLAGRIWCGYTCPQSVWTWMFMWVEKVTEGDRGARIRLDKAPWSIPKVLRRSAKHGLWILISVLTGVVFVGYFTPVRTLVMDMATLNADAGSVFWVAVFTLLTYLNAGWVREKVCLHMCPYARFQSVMFDENTYVIAYDAGRGEKRGARRKGVIPQQQGLGDCVDCTLCVQVCPTGIDIRNGLQMDCIGCAACIDVCNEVMDKLDYPRGLIRYTTEQCLKGGRSHVFRPRVIAYGLILLAMIVFLAWAVQARALLGLDVSKDRGLYRENHLGQIENAYILSVMNKTQQVRRYTLSLSDPAVPMALRGEQVVTLQPGTHLELPVDLVLMEPVSDTKPIPVVFRLRDVEDPTSEVITSSLFTVPSVR